MKQIQKIENILHTRPILVILLLSVIIIVSFLLFVPKVSSRLFPIKQQILWERFRNETLTKGFNPQTYWEFREFYSPGYFIYNKTASINEITQSLKTYQINSPASFLTLLTFHSPRLSSIDTLTTHSKLDDILENSPLMQAVTIYRTENARIFLETKKVIVITFILPVSEMQKANGFFDYRDEDKELVKNKFWFNVTRITLP